MNPEQRRRHTGFVPGGIKLVLAALGLLWALPAQAQVDRLRAAILGKLLSNDTRLTSRVKGTVVLGVLTDRKTDGKRAAVMRAFGPLAKMSLQGRSVRVVGVSVFGPDHVAEQVSRAGANTLYVVPGVADGVLDAVARYAALKRCPAFGGDSGAARRGLAAAISLSAGKLNLVVNVPAHKKQGMLLSSSVLRLAKLIK